MNTSAVAHLRAIPSDEEQFKSSVWNTHPFLKLLSKIGNAVKVFFEKIKNFLFSSPYHLTERDIECINKAKNRLQASSFSTSHDLNQRKVKSVSAEPLNEAGAEDQSVKDNPNFNNPVYQEFLNKSEDFITHALEVGYDEIVKPSISDLQSKIDKTQEFLSWTTDFAITIGAQLKSPLEEKLSRFKITEFLEPDMAKLMQWLLKDKNKINKNIFFEDIKKKINKSVDERYLDWAIKACRNWLFYTDQSVPLGISNYQGAQKGVLEKVFKEAILVLAEQKIREFNHKVKENFTNKLPIIAKSIMIENGKKISSIVIKRLIEIIDQAPFSETFDSIIELLADHSSAVIAGENAREYAKQQESAYLDKCDQAASDKVQTDEILEANRQLLIQARAFYTAESRDFWIKNQVGLSENDAKKRIEDVYQNPNEEARKNLDQEIRNSWLDDIGEKAACDAYRKYLVKGKPLCHPKIDELELVQDTKNVDKQKRAEKLEERPAMFPKEQKQENHLFDATAERLMQLLFPSVDVEINHQIEKVDGLLYLLSQIEYGDEIKYIYQEAKYIYQDILTDSVQNIIFGTIKKYYTEIEKKVLLFFKHHIKNTISETTASIFQKLIVPEKIDEMNVKSTLPALQETLLGGLAKSIIAESANIKIFAPLFRKWIDEDNEEAQNNLINPLMEKVRKNLRGYEIEDKKLIELVNEEIIYLKKFLKEVFENRENNDDEDLDLIYIEVLKGFFKTRYHGNNPQYGELAVNMIFKVGKLNSKAEYFSRWFKGTLAKEITAASYEMQESPDFLVKKTTSQISRNYSTKESVRDLLFNQPEEFNADELQKKLKEQLAKTAHIFHAQFYYQSLQQSWYIRKPIQAVIGHDHTKLEKVINRIYHKMLGNPLYMQNFMVRFQEHVSKALQKGVEAVAAKTETVQKVDYIPSLRPSFMEIT